jgi:predicted nucleotidyltransferase
VCRLVSDVGSIHLVYLFGSRIDGEIGPLSDYDFAVVLAQESDLLATQTKLMHQLSVALGTDKVDVIVLNRAPIELAYAVIAQGTRLYERSVEDRVEYEAKVLGLYGDYLPTLRAQRADILRGGSNDARVQRYRAALGRTERSLGQIAADAGQDPG